jgi:hypothetical protein
MYSWSGSWTDAFSAALPLSTSVETPRVLDARQDPLEEVFGRTLRPCGSPEGRQRSIESLKASRVVYYAECVLASFRERHGAKA